MLDLEKLLNIDWVAIPGGTILLEHTGTVEVQPLHIARHPITYAQYRVFIETDDGYKNPAWWQDLKHKAKPGKQHFREDTYPAENVSWYDAVAFCRWLSNRLGVEIRLPTEWEWQQAASGGDSKRVVPWGIQWSEGYCNTYESGLHRTCGVQQYPHGASPQGVLNLAGNVSEWCQNKYHTLKVTEVDISDNPRVVRGGSWHDSGFRARLGYRNYYEPDYRFLNVGFRLCCSSLNKNDSISTPTVCDGAKKIMQQTESEWISVKDGLPKNAQNVLCFYKNSLGKGCIVKAFYAEKYTIESKNNDNAIHASWWDAMEWDENTENYYLEQGWYECINNWDAFTSIKIHEGDVTFWRPLPSIPNSEIKQ